MQFSSAYLFASFALTIAASACHDALAQEKPVAHNADAAPSGSIVLHLHTLKDPGSGDMNSHTVLAPVGWDVKGSAWWGGPALFNIFPSQDVKITSPEGVQVHIGPSLACIDYLPSALGAQYGGKRPEEYTAEAGQLVLHVPGSLPEWQTTFQQKLLPRSYPGATEIHVQPVVIVPELTQILQKQITPFKEQAHQTNQHNRQMGIQMQSSVDGAILAVSSTYTINEQKWEQLNVFGVTYFINEVPTGRQIHWGVEPTVAYRAPAGKLEANLPLLLAISNSIRPTPEWATMKADHIAKMNQISAKGAADRSRIIAESNREVSRIINEGWQQRQATMDRTHHRTINAIREVDDFTSSNHQTPVQLPHHYQHVYTNGSQYILTNDANYDPNLDKTINQHTWESMKRVQP